MSDILVRMYNVGFGDCFLIEIPTGPSKKARILVDCGSTAKAAKSMEDILTEVFTDTEEDGNPRIDVIICTHRHRDHVSGFADPRWKDVRVKEVWFPWTEDPKDDAARKIRNAQSKLAAALVGHWAARAQLAPGDATVAAWSEMAMNALTNEKAMAMLHGGIASKPEPRYLWDGYENGELSSELLPGVTVHVLGPSKDPDIIRDLDPPKGKSFVSHLQADGRIRPDFEPFGDEWPISPEAFSWPHLKLSGSDPKDLKETAEEWDPTVTAALDQAVNGTSLVLAFEIGKTVLLFPGDAQWGTWNKILSDPGKTDLLERATFLKVGHHGSHNATPREFVEQHLLKDGCTMMSTRVGSYASIPRGPLLDALKARTKHFARSDQGEEAPKFFKVRKGVSIEALLPVE